MTRHDYYLYVISIKDNTGTPQTLRWSRGTIDSTIFADIADNPVPRVFEGGLEYESPDFDPHEPSHGVVPAAQPIPIVAAQFDGDLDQYRTWRWAGATITIYHGGYTDEEGWLDIALWPVVNTVEVDGWPTLDLDRMTIPLRSREARFEAQAERRTMAALDWCLEGNGASVGVSWNPEVPGIQRRAASARAGTVSTAANVTVTFGDFEIGDLLVIRLAAAHAQLRSTMAYQPWTAATPSGWTSRYPAAATTGGADVHRLYVFTRVAQSGDPATVTITPGGGSVACDRAWQTDVFHGQHATTEIPTGAGGGTGAGSAAATATAPSVTTPNDGDVLLAIYSTAVDMEPHPAVPTGMLNIGHTSKKLRDTATYHYNRATLDTYVDTVESAGVVAAKVIPHNGDAGYVLSPSSRSATISLVIGNRVGGGGNPSKFDLRNSMSVQFAFIPRTVGTAQQLFGWYATPFRCYLDASRHLCWSWKKGGSTVTKTSTFTFSAGRRYHVEIVHTDTLVTFVIYDWHADSQPDEIQEFAGTGFNGRDAPAAGDEFTALFRKNSGAGSEYFDGHFWIGRGWSAAIDFDVLSASRMRQLTDGERVDTQLAWDWPLDERGGSRVTDAALNPASGVISVPATGAATLRAYASGQKVTRTGGSWVTDGFQVDDVVFTSGLGDNDIRSWIITTVAANDLGLRCTEEGVDVVDTAAGDGDEQVTVHPWRPTLTGTIEQNGSQVPAVYGGPVDRVPLVLVDSTLDGALFMIHPTEIWKWQSIDEGGANRALVHAEDPNSSTGYFEFCRAIPEPGSWLVLTSEAGSFARCKTIPALPVSATVVGDAYGWEEAVTAADVARRILSRSGEERLVDPTDFDTDSIDALNAAAPKHVGLAIGEGQSISDAVRLVLGSVGAVCWPIRSGKFRMAQFLGDGLKTPVRNIHRKVYLTASPKALPVKLPVKSVKIKYRRNWLPLQRAQVNGDIDPDTQAWLYGFLVKEWREIPCPSSAVKKNYPRSRELKIESYLLYSRDAAAEALRQAQLFAKPPQWIELQERRLGLPLELFDEVTLDITDLAASDGSTRARIGTSATPFVVTKISDLRVDGLTRLRLWRKDSTA